MTCGFGGGMGRKGEVCGAVTGGIMVIGAVHGRGEKDELTVTDQTYARVREFMDRFAGRQGTFLCRQLLSGCDLTTQEGQKYFRENGLRDKVCVPCIQAAVEIPQEDIVTPSDVCQANRSHPPCF